MARQVRSIKPSKIINDATLPVTEASKGCLLRVASVTFSDSTTIVTPDNSVTVFCGPNNAGKSLALREIAERLHHSSPTKLVKEIKDKRVGTASEVLKHIVENSKSEIVRSGYTEHHLKGLEFHFIDESVARRWSGAKLDSLADFFIDWMPTENRIQDSDSVQNIAHTEAPEHPLHYLHGNLELTKEISSEFQRVFGRQLVVDYGAGSAVSLRVGEEPEIDGIVTPVSRTYIERLHQQAVLIENEGDGVRSFATILLRSLAAPYKQIFFLDEPEAFLHPPQAKLLGEFIARLSLSGKQIFVATHSIDILEGLMSITGANVTIARIDRGASESRVSYLDAENGNSIWSDPVARHAGLIQGVFHKQAVICESDADCLFYSLVGKSIDSEGFGQKEIYFTSSNGKSGIPRYATALRALGVPTAAVVDIDVLSDSSLMKAIFEALGGDWSIIAKDFAAVKAAVESRKPLLNAKDVASLISTVITAPPVTTKELKSSVNAVFAEANPWDFLKHAGRAGVPSGEPMKAFDRLVEASSAAGLWIVPEGEIEGFCRSASASHGPRFIRTILETRDLQSDPELKEARNFVAKVLALST